MRVMSARAWSSVTPGASRASPEPVRPAHAAEQGLVVDARSPVVGLGAREIEPAWHHADDLNGGAVEVDGAAYYRRIAGKTTAPKAVAEDDDVALPALFFGWGKRPTESGVGTEDGKEVR